MENSNILCTEITTNNSDNETQKSNNISPFYIDQILTVENFDNTAVTYANLMKYEFRRETARHKAQNPQYNNTYFKYVCCRAGKPPPKKPNEQQLRPHRTSLKCDCGWYVRASHPMKEDKTGRDESVVKIVGLCLEHTNGCTGSNELMNKAIRKRRGRNYSEIAILHLRKEVKAGRYSTRDVKGWLVENGMQDVTLEEATNLRYRLLKDLPIKGWDFGDEDKEKMGEIQNFLFNEDLAMEITAGAKKSVDNLQVVHCGLAQQVEGYDYRVCCDSEKRFTGTCWQTGRMRNRLRKHGRLIFLDDSRSGINTSGFCFWNIVVVDHDGKVQTVMGAMTMTASNDAVKWILKSMVEMCPEAAYIVKVTMSDLGVMEEPIKSVLIHVEYCGACTWHIMTIDFPKNLGHLQDYTAIKSFVYDKLVHNTTNKYDWEAHLAAACKKWPSAANYLHELSRSKERWGAPWRLEHLTLGYESSSPVEGSFSAFQRAIGDSPKSFVGVVQEHVKKDIEKVEYEGRAIINSQIRAHDDDIKKSRSDAGNECAIVFSEYITDRFESTNHDAQNYVHHEVTLTSEQTAKGVTKAHSVCRRRTAADIENPPPPRIVEEINGVKFCSCLEDVNKGEPCRHIQCVLGGAFVEQQFSCNWKVPKDVSSDDKAAPLDDLQNHSNHAEDGSDTVIENTLSVLPIESSILASNLLSTADAVPQSSGTPIPASSSQSSVSTRHSTTIAKKKKKMDSVQKYNTIMQEAKQLANTASQEDYDTYNKVLCVLKWMRSNIQNKGNEEIIAAAADYMGIQRGPIDTTLETPYNGSDIQPPLLKRTAGVTSTHRKKSRVENAVTTQKVKTCKFCHGAHTIKQCSEAALLGTRLTKATWNNMMFSVTKLDENFVTPSQLDPVVPSDAMMLQLVGYRDTKDSQCYLANVILHGLKQKEAPPIFLHRNVIERWSHSGASTSHYRLVLAKRKSRVKYPGLKIQKLFSLK